MTGTIDRETQPIDTAATGKNKPKKIGIPKEIFNNEFRVAATPDTAQKLQKLGFTVLIETEAGAKANFPDATYQAVDCEIVPDAATLWNWD
jgi:H+-translocating NAD(P) transhydrogenase subunit alpha